MKKIIFRKITTYSLLLTLFCLHLCQTAFAQQTSSAFDTGLDSIYTKPSSAVVGSTSERQTAWNNLTEVQKDETTARLKEIIDSAKKQQSQQNLQPKNTALSFVDGTGSRSDVQASVKPNDTEIMSFSQDIRTPYTKCCRPLQDADGDGFTETFESSLADGFTPYYHISAGEKSGTGFALFNDSVPQTVSQSFGSVPPISYYRVTPLGFGNINGAQHGFVQLDFLTLWNRDDGLDIGALCYSLAPVLGLSFDELTSHILDNERSAILVAAPVGISNIYNTNPSEYKAYQFFTGAHEDTFFDSSMSFVANPPVAHGLHIELGIARSKHGAYTFNPNGLPLFPEYVIYSTYATIEFMYYNYEISWYTYLSLLYTADTVFFACIIERFQDQGGTYAGTRINVGELSRPINGSGFILDPALTQKLQKYF